jgi:photosystem II stability/assembly factor-like uncharacterized protein
LKNDNLSGLRITCLAEAPNGWIYAGTAWNVAKCLSRSTNNGETWQTMIETDTDVLAIKFNSNGHIYVGSRAGFYRSKDNGTSWTLNNNGLIGFGITAIEVLFDSIIYAATEQGIHKTTDEGDNWFPINQGLIPAGQYIPTNSIIWRNDTLYTNTTNAVYFSTNFGDQWIQRATNHLIENLQIDNNNVFYLQRIVPKNLLRSFDYGVTWDTAYTFSDWFKYYKVYNDRLYAGIYTEGLFVSADSGNSFQEHFIKPYHQPEISSFKIINDTHWLTGTHGFGVFSSNDQGLSWEKKGPLKMGASHMQVNLQNEIFVNCNYNVYKSTDYANTWNYIPPPYFPSTLDLLTLSHTDELYASYSSGDGSSIFNFNNTNTWDSLATLYNPGYGYCQILSLIVDKYEDAYLSLFFGPWGGFKTFKEHNNFNTFEEIFNSKSALAFNDSGYVFFGNSRMYRTTDRGDVIEEINNGISSLAAYSIKAIDFDEIYIGDYNKLYISTNNGDNWYSIPGPSEANGIHSIEKVGEGYLVIASRNGIYKNTTVVSVGENNSETAFPSKFFLSQNYPNPFNPKTTIWYAIPTMSFVTFKIYDVLGNEIATLVNEDKSIGNYEVEFNASRLASGIYFYQLQAGEFVETKKMVLMK